MSIREKIAKGSVWISAARLINNCLTAFSTVILSIFLAPEMFGIVFIATSILTILTAFTELSLSFVLIALKDPKDSHYDTAWTLGVLRGLILTLILACISPAVATAYHDPRLQLILIAVALNPTISSLRSPKLAKLEKELTFHQLFFMDTATSLITLIFSIAIAFWYHSYWALVIGTIAGSAAGVIVSYVLIPYWPRITLSKWRELFGFSVWLSLAQIVGVINYRVDQLLVGAYLGKTELGLYTVGGRLAQLPGREVTRPLTATLYPAFATADGNFDRLRMMYRRSQNVVAAVALPVTTGVALLADGLVTHLMSESWHGVVFVIQLMAAVTSIETLGTLVEPLAMADKQTRLLLVRDVQKFCIRIPLLIVGAVFGGFTGLIWCRAIAGVIGVAVDMMLVKRILSFSLLQQIWDNRRTLCACAFMAVMVLAALKVTPDPHGTLAFVVWMAALSSWGAVCYVVGSLLLWTLSGKPEGPETEFIALANGIVRRFKRSTAV